LRGGLECAAQASKRDGGREDGGAAGQVHWMAPPMVAR
jgi:hypothetical protein